MPAAEAARGRLQAHRPAVKFLEQAVERLRLVGLHRQRGELEEHRRQLLSLGPLGALQLGNRRLQRLCVALQGWGMGQNQTWERGYRCQTGRERREVVR